MIERACNKCGQWSSVEAWYANLRASAGGPGVDVCPRCGADTWNDLQDMQRLNPGGSSAVCWNPE